MDIQTPQTETVAIYARYSSDMQNPYSCDDQIVECQKFIARNDSLSGRPITVYRDDAKSGSAMLGRSGIQRLFEDIESGNVLYVVTEAIDRISRRQEYMAKFYSLCDYHDVGILSVHEGKVNELHIGLKGTMSQMYVKQLAERVRRGQFANVRRGKSGGGLPYGYKVKLCNDEGAHEPGLREIHPEQAKIVQRIYDEYTAGKKIKDILYSLNADGVPSARGGLWTAVSITGHYGRHNGILQNPIYKGQIIFNRRNYRRHPETDARHMRHNPAEEWTTCYNPALRIIDDAQWELAQKIRRETYQGWKEMDKTITCSKFDCKIVCGHCGRNMNRATQEHLICGQYKRSRACEQSKKVNIKKLCDAIYEHINENLHLIWQDWQKEVRKENKSRAKKHLNGSEGGNFSVVLLSLNDGNQRLFLEALKREENNKVAFIARLLKQARIKVEKDGRLIINDLMPKWKTLEQLG